MLASSETAGLTSRTGVVWIELEMFAAVVCPTTLRSQTLTMFEPVGPAEAK